MSSSFEEIPKGLNRQLKILKHAMKYLNKINDPVKIFNDSVAYEALYFIQKILHEEKFFRDNHKWKLFTKYNFDEVMVKMWHYLAAIFDELNFYSHRIFEANLIKANTANERRVQILDFMVTITHSISENQYKHEVLTTLTSNLLAKNILKPLVSIIKREKLLTTLNDNHYVYDLIIGFLAILLDLSENTSNNSDENIKQLWKKLNVEAILNQLKGWVSDYAFLIKEIKLNINKKTLEESLDFLQTFSNDLSKAIANEQVYFDLLFMFKSVHVYSFNQHKVFIKYDTKKLFHDLLQIFYELRNDMNYSFKVKYDYPNLTATLEERKVSIFAYLILIINNIIYASIEIALYFQDKDSIRILLSFLSDDEFLKKSMMANPGIVSNLMNNLTVLSKYSDDNRKDWLDLNTINIVIKLTKSRFISIKENKIINDKIILSANKCIGHLVHGDEIDSINGFDAYVKKLIEFVNKYEKHVKMDAIAKIHKKVTEYMTDENQIIKIRSSHFDNASLLSRLNELRRFSFSLKFRQLIFRDAKTALKSIIYQGNNIEKLVTLKLMCQLSFDLKENAANLSNDSDFMRFIKELQDKQYNVELKQACERLLWIIDQEMIEKAVIVPNKNQILEKSMNKNVMLSFNITKKEVCLKIKEELNNIGYNVWMNLNEPNGCFLKETTKAIEESQCVLVCICEKYRFSEMCQIEAKYAMRLNKEIIPIIIQDGYDNIECWIGSLFVDRKKIYFLDNVDLKESIKQLDIELIFKKIQKENLVSRTRNVITNKLVENWSVDEVTKWFTDNEINDALCKNYSQFDGYLLKQLYMIRLETPEFFFQSVMSETGNGVKLADIAFFMQKLETLFSKS